MQWPKDLPFSTAFSDYQQGTGSEVKELGLEPVTIWDASAAGDCFMCYTTALTSKTGFKQQFSPGMETSHRFMHTNFMSSCKSSYNFSEQFVHFKFVFILCTYGGSVAERRKRQEGGNIEAWI